jgi:hypothetical protein
MKPRHPWRSGRAAITLALWPVIIVLSPVILLVGEPVNRYVMRRLRGNALMAGAAGDRVAWVATPVRLTLLSSLLLTAIRNPLWIALTAPGRWVADQYSRVRYLAGE